MDRRADVVTKSGQRQFGSARAAADRIARFQNEYGQSLARQRDRRGETIRPRTDDNGIELGHGDLISRVHIVSAMCHSTSRVGLASGCHA